MRMTGARELPSRAAKFALVWTAQRGQAQEKTQTGLPQADKLGRQGTGLLSRRPAPKRSGVEGTLSSHRAAQSHPNSTPCTAALPWAMEEPPGGRERPVFFGGGRVGGEG